MPVFNVAINMLKHYPCNVRK